MGLQFRKRIKLSKGLGITISKSGVTPSYRTKKGSISSKGYSIRTGIPGVSYRQTFKKTKGNGCLMSILWFVFSLLLITPTSCMSDKKTADKDVNKNLAIDAPNTTWYSGGTLHKSTIKTWKNATEKNKLATCADFCANRYNTLSLTDIKVVATNLKTCIDEAVNHTLAVSEVAAMCLILLEN